MLYRYNEKRILDRIKFLFPTLMCYCSGKIVLRPAQGHYTYMETSPIAAEGLQILPYSRHLLPFSSQGFLTCHIYRCMIFTVSVSD